MGSLNFTIVFLSPFWALDIGAITEAIRMKQKAATTSLKRFVMYLLFRRARN
jgi:hypothetical protein